MKIITLSILQWLSDNGFGTIDEDLFWEKLGLGKVGLYISDVGDTQDRSTLPSTTYEIYSRGTNDLDGYKRLQAVADFIKGSYGVCNLPAASGYTDEGYENITLDPPTTISSVGEDGNGRMIYSITGRVHWL